MYRGRCTPGNTEATGSECAADRGIGRIAEEVGFTSLWLVDHFHTIPQPSQEITFECWTSLAALARDTKTIRIGPMVSCNGYRNPALLAKMASTVDVLSHGRLNFGIGGGWFEHEYRAYGYDYPATGERLQRLGEAVQVILAMWTQDEAVFAGRYHQVRGAINQPKGIQKPHIPLLIGGSGEQVTLKLVAQYGDACNVNGDVPTLRRKFDILRQHCEAIGRDYESIHRTTAARCALGETNEAARAKFPPGLLERTAGAINTSLVGNRATIHQGLEELEAAGVQEVIVSFPDVLQPDTLRSFAQEFMV